MCVSMKSAGDGQNICGIAVQDYMGYVHGEEKSERTVCQC